MCARAEKIILMVCDSRVQMDLRIHWYIYKSKKPIPKLTLTFSPRTPGNKWLLHEQIIDDLPIIKLRTLDVARARANKILNSGNKSKMIRIILDNTNHILMKPFKNPPNPEFLKKKLARK